MKRFAFASLAIALAAFSASAQGLTMGTMNGWTFTFSGNVNAFLTYTSPSCSGSTLQCNTWNSPFGSAGNIIPSGDAEKVVRIRTGLAPAFAIFDAKGKEGDMDLGVHFGFAPEIQTPNRAHNNCDGYGNLSVQCGAQIDMREVYLTAGGTWGQILAGRAIGLYAKENLLTDMTVFGFGLSGGGAIGGGTSLGHIGTGYLYPNFNSQITYSTAGNKEGQLQVGLFDPSVEGNFDITDSPRLEAEYVWTHHTGAAGSADKVMVYLSGMVQALSSSVTTISNVTPVGIAGGVEFNKNGLQADLSGSYNNGLGNIAPFDGLGLDAANKMRTSYTYLIQLQYALSDNKWKFGASYGNDHLSQTDADKTIVAQPLIQNASSIVVAATYMYTKSLRGVLEYTNGSAKAYSGAKTTSNQIAAGMMLFF